jgi:hypothetical protein
MRHALAGHGSTAQRSVYQWRGSGLLMCVALRYVAGWVEG